MLRSLFHYRDITIVRLPIEHMAVLATASEKYRRCELIFMEAPMPKAYEVNSIQILLMEMNDFATS